MFQCSALKIWPIAFSMASKVSLFSLVDLIRLFLELSMCCRRHAQPGPGSEGLGWTLTPNSIAEPDYCSFNS